MDQKRKIYDYRPAWSPENRSVDKTGILNIKSSWKRTIRKFIVVIVLSKERSITKRCHLSLFTDTTTATVSIRYYYYIARTILFETRFSLGL